MMLAAFLLAVCAAVVHSNVNATRVNLHLANRCNEDLLVYWYNPVDKMLTLHYGALHGLLRDSGRLSDITFLSYATHIFLVSSVLLDTEQPVDLGPQEADGALGALSALNGVNTTRIVVGVPLHPGREPPETHSLLITRLDSDVPGEVGQLTFVAEIPGPSVHERAIFKKVASCQQAGSDVIDAEFLACVTHKALDEITVERTARIHAERALISERSPPFVADMAAHARQHLCNTGEPVGGEQRLVRSDTWPHGGTSIAGPFDGAECHGQRNWWQHEPQRNLTVGSLSVRRVCSTTSGACATAHWRLCASCREFAACLAVGDARYHFMRFRPLLLLCLSSRAKLSIR
jgi:hypothetical protein